MSQNTRLSDEELEELLGEINSDRSKPKTRLLKLTMTSNSNKGTVLFVPVPDAKTGKFYLKVTGVREVNQFTRLNDKIEGDCWHKILPKSYYEGITPEQSMLYDQCVKMFDELYESGAWGSDVDRSAVARYRTYSFFYGYILNHVDENNKVISDNVNKTAILMYPTNKAIDGLADTITTKKLAAQGSISFLGRYFSRATVGRTGAISIKISGGKGGYNVAVSLEGNSEDNPYLVPNDLDLSGSFELCQDAIADYLGWQCRDAEETYFREDLFLEMREYFSGYYLENGKINPEYLPKEENSSEGDPLNS